MTKKKKINLNKISKTFLWGLLLVFVAITVFFAVEQATRGSEIALLEKEKITLENRKRELTEELVQTSSLNGAEKKAEELGFVKPSNLVYISEKEAVAKLP
jgi:CHASE3 domain sensor protein